MRRMILGTFWAVFLARAIWPAAVLAQGSGPTERTVQGEPAGRYADRWVMIMTNLLVDSEADRALGVIDQAGKAGYNGLLLADFKFNLLEAMPERYFKNVGRIKAACAEREIEIIPGLFPIGRSDGLLMHDTNLAEGLPVTDAPYVVRERKARLAPEPAVAVKNGDFERTRGDDKQFADFYQDEPGKISFVDRAVFHGGRTSCRFENIGPANARVIQPLKVRPHAAYRLSCWVKTSDLAPATIKLLANGKRPLTYHEMHLAPTQDWTLAEVAFNSLDESEINIYAGQWGGGKGKLWIDDLACEELSLVNVLRREGCPLRVTDATGRREFVEGEDFEPVVDPLLGQTPYAGQYRFDHAGARLRLTTKSAIHEGDRLRVSWYHPIKIHDEEVACCLTEPKVYELLADQARRVNEMLKPKTFFMEHDELRCANWCAACRKKGKTPGELLANNAARCVYMLSRINPRARVVTWSDMFDPHHNAKQDFYLVNGTLAESWLGLPKEVIICNWNSGHAAESLRFFAGQGHEQVIAGYYNASVGEFDRWGSAMKEVFPAPAAPRSHGRDVHDLAEQLRRSRRVCPQGVRARLATC